MGDNSINYIKEKEFCRKWISLLERIDSDASLKNRCLNTKSYSDIDKLTKELDFSTFLKEGYESGIVVKDYRSIMPEEYENIIFNPDDDFIEKLSELEIIACIAWHFRCDHFTEGFLLTESFPNGSLLKLFKALLKN